MEENQIINYGNANYSLAMIDFDIYIELLNSMDERLLEVKKTFNIIMRKNEKTQLYSQVLNKYLLPVFCKERNFINQTKTSIEKHKEKVKQYLDENPIEQNLFNEKLTELTTLMQDNENMVKDYIAQIFNYNQAIHEANLTE